MDRQTPATPAAKSRSGAYDIDQRYVKRAMAQPLLERAEEQDLARRWQQDGDERALHTLTEAHMRLAISIAAKYRRYGLPFGDLIQEGNIGLMKAAERFDPERDIRFSTYASWWIRSCVQDYVLRNWSIVRTGTTSAQKSLFFNLRRMRALIGDMDGSNIKPENSSRIAQSLNVRESDVEAMAARISAADRSLNAPIGDEDGSEWQDFLADDAETPDTVTMRKTDRERRSAWLADALESLNERELMIIRERRLVESGSTLEALARKLGISKERVRQIEAGAFQKLKSALTSLVGDPYEAELIPAE